MATWRKKIEIYTLLKSTNVCLDSKLKRFNFLKWFKQYCNMPHILLSFWTPKSTNTYTSESNLIPNRMVHTLCTQGKFRLVLFAAIQLYYLNRSVSKILALLLLSCWIFDWFLAHAAKQNKQYAKKLKEKINWEFGMNETWKFKRFAKQIAYNSFNAALNERCNKIAQYLSGINYDLNK